MKISMKYFIQVKNVKLNTLGLNNLIFDIFVIVTPKVA